MIELLVTAQHRFLGLFPHPDDESLGAGILLQRAARVGAAVLPLFLTSGEGNSWPQRVLDRKLKLEAHDRVRFALRRQGEVQRALETLGISPRAAQFLRWPDTQLTQLLLHRGEELVDRLAQEVERFQPTHLIAPVLADHHPDHSATAVLAFALGQRFPQLRLLGYTTHAHLAPQQELAVLSGSPHEVSTKYRAIQCHTSQLVFRRRFHLQFATAREVFYPLTARENRQRLEARLAEGKLDLSFTPRLSWRCGRTPCLWLVTMDETLRGLRLPLVQKSRWWQPRVGPWQTVLELPKASPWVLVKVSRPFLLYDEAGFVLAEQAQALG
ncbi:MAG: PIG-L family deacetylase [Thermoanaerobaculum sp.]|nr:PIG-L family deacetylase [Thermoanaerobaculum sp.]